MSETCPNNTFCSEKSYSSSEKEYTEQNQSPLRWGYSTGACFSALALASWFEIQGQKEKLYTKDGDFSVKLLFNDGAYRFIPLLSERKENMLTLAKDAGDDPDCTDKALFYGQVREASLEQAKAEDYILEINNARLIIRALEGIGLVTRLGLDCELGKWAINSAPRDMLKKNLALNGMHTGVWIFECGVEQGAEIAKKSLNSHLGILGGISILGSTGLVRPFSHDAYKASIQICVRSHALSGGTSMVFCTGGRTKKGAQKALTHLADTAFTCIADFIATSISYACQYKMQEIIIACMPGKLCKYAAGFENTHAHKVEQDLEYIRKAVKNILPHASLLHKALEESVSVRESLLSIPEEARLDILQDLTEEALHKLTRFCTLPITSARPSTSSISSSVNSSSIVSSSSTSSTPSTIQILLFDFQGNFLLSKKTIFFPPNAQKQENAQSAELKTQKEEHSEKKRDFYSQNTEIKESFDEGFIEKNFIEENFIEENFGKKNILLQEKNEDIDCYYFLRQKKLRKQ